MSIEQVKSLVAKNREIIVQTLQDSGLQEGTKGACLYASIIGCITLNRFTKAEVIIRGGDGDGDGGIKVDGALHGHYWLEADIDGNRYVIDITADQFGMPPVIIERVEVMQQIYLPGDQVTVDEHVREMMDEIGGGGDGQ